MPVQNANNAFDLDVSPQLLTNWQPQALSSAPETFHKECAFHCYHCHLPVQTIKFSSSLQPPQILPSYQLLYLLCYRACSASQNLDVRIVELNKALESPLDSKEIKPVNPKGNQPWIFIGRTDAEAPITWPPQTKSWLTGKDSDTGKDWGQEEKGATENEMVDGIINSMAMSLRKLWKIVKNREAWCLKQNRESVHGVSKSWKQLSDWTTMLLRESGCTWGHHFWGDGYSCFLP